MEERDALLKRKVEPSVAVLPAEELEKLDAIIDKYAGQAGHLIPALKEAQDLYGYLPMEVQHRLAYGMNIPASHIYGVVTFYSFFTITPRGRHTIRLCLGTACYVKGSKDILENIVREVGINVGETSEDGRFTLEAVRCLGACGLAPVMLIGEDTHGNIHPPDTIKILDGYQ
ncbi:NADH-quinone oxidoreductase subunit NuoE [Desulfomonile tiedjei]|uniref:NADH:ubiquinone oxidoreductase 24 kD subunit n=1 Tax=Desulfomonile tiedjei (strain ATCC 49306 / DSM 6799 / DCB-1) TaxID=706587 RepID=I4C786_DESTA|nr:NADH-quinone oxidoreductase subunit NuoE [Desulfomonile tiedjei]AFM25427.1 NADH:ubiquinone oxidoreductase 24 kD subunit [Desulfomonile tiedjei DSM 6799]